MGTLLDLASLVMIPSGVKEDKLYSVKPTDGSGDFTFSRNSDIQATRVNSSGLIEKAKVNLVLQSNQFDTTWTNNDSTETGGQSGYDGTNDAWLLNKTTFNGRIEQTISKTGVLTFSVYAKAGTKNWVYLRVDGSGGNHTAYFDLSGSGALGSTSLAIDSAIEAAGNGYYRCSVTFSDTTTIARIYVADGDNDTSGTSGNIYIQDAQLNHGLIAQDYVETTTTAVVEGLTADLPRLDYSGGASCPSLLLEPSRTNLVPDSEYLNSSNWSKVQSSVTSNATNSPEGLSNASFVVPNTSNAIHSILTNTGISSGTYTLSVFAKQGGYKNLLVWFDGHSGGVGVNLDDLSVFRDQNNDGYNIESFDNGWVRISVTCTISTGSPIDLYIYDNASTPNITHAGDGTSGVYIYGAQLEVGSYPTSYIPTYGASSQRNADAASKTGISDLIGQTEGTMFVELDYTNTGQSQTYISISDGTLDNRITLSYSLTLNCLNAFARVGGSTQALMTSATSPANGIKKIAVAYKLNDYRFYINGTEVAIDGSAIVPTCSRIDVGSLLATGNESSVKQALLFKTRLSNAELAALTTI